MSCIENPDPSDRDVTTTQPLDRARLEEVLRGIARSAPDFVAEFRRSTDADVKHLLDACRSGDRSRVARVVHRIKGASKVIGAGPLGQACGVVEQALELGDAGALQPAIDALLTHKQALYDCLNQLPSATAPADSEGSAVCGGLVFMVVEDHEFQRGMIVRLLRQLGALEIHDFPDGASALAAARKVRSPAIMVLDLAMPAVGGTEVMQISGQERLPLSIIINSALGEDLLRWTLQTARSYGATVLGAVSKPLTAAKLAPLLARHRQDQRPGFPCARPPTTQGNGQWLSQTASAQGAQCRTLV